MKHTETVELVGGPEDGRRFERDIYGPVMIVLHAHYERHWIDSGAGEHTVSSYYYKRTDRRNGDAVIYEFDR